MPLYQFADRVSHGGLCLLTSSTCFALPERQSASRTLRLRTFLYEANTTVQYVLKSVKEGKRCDTVFVFGFASPFLLPTKRMGERSDFLVNSDGTRNRLAFRVSWIGCGIKKSRRRCRDER